MILTAEQTAARDAIKKWHDEGGEEPFRLFGAAGTGKTSLAKYIAQAIGGKVLFATFTGKAASVLRLKGCPATTIHKLIYKPAEKSKSLIKQLGEELESELHALQEAGKTPEEIEQDAKVISLRRQIAAEHKETHRPVFSLNIESELRSASLLVLDECSMVDERIGHDLQSFDVPILVVGDPYQLPPIRGHGFFTSAAPDFMLNEIHRQAADNPILKLATMARNGIPLVVGQYGDSKVILKKDIDPAEVMKADQIIVGLNATRHKANARYREKLGMPAGLPCSEDRIVCRRNNHEAGLLNGEHWMVDSVFVGSCGKHGKRQELDLILKPHQRDGGQISCLAHAEYFLGEQPPPWEIKDRECFEYGYAITTHTAQGSEWDFPFIFDESRYFRQNANNWLYTAITRAAKNVTIVIGM